MQRVITKHIHSINTEFEEKVCCGKDQGISKQTKQRTEGEVKGEDNLGERAICEKQGSMGAHNQEKINLQMLDLRAPACILPNCPRDPACRALRGWSLSPWEGASSEGGPTPHTGETHPLWRVDIYVFTHSSWKLQVCAKCFSQRLETEACSKRTKASSPGT